MNSPLDGRKSRGVEGEYNGSNTLTFTDEAQSDDAHSDHYAYSQGPLSFK